MTTTTERLGTSRDRILVAGLFLAVSMSAFEITAVLTALPSIVSELNGERFYGATLAVYLLASLISVVASGEMADRRGPSLPFALGVGLFKDQRSVDSRCQPLHARCGFGQRGGTESPSSRDGRFNPHRCQSRRLGTLVPPQNRCHRLRQCRTSAQGERKL